MLIVGGGATGVGVARDLALRGVDVTLAERGGLANAASVVGGKLTTYRQMAEGTADLVCEHLGVDADVVAAD